MNNYKVYIQHYPINGVEQPIVDLEATFDGLKYKEATGMSAKGKPKIYVENYPETSEARVYIPDDVVRENTNIDLTLVFIGDNRRNVFDSFVEFITGKKLKLWDTVRNRVAHLVLNDKVDMDEDVLKGDIPYIVAKFSFLNLFGETFKQ